LLDGGGGSTSSCRKPEDIKVDKHRISGFWDTPLDSILRNLGTRTVLFSGVNTDQCVMHSLTDANFLGLWLRHGRGIAAAPPRPTSAPRPRYGTSRNASASSPISGKILKAILRSKPGGLRDLVLLPGFMCDQDLWTDMVPDLQRLGHLHHGNVYEDSTLDGHGRQARPSTPRPSASCWSAFSMGGFVSRVICLMAPERVSGVAFRRLPRRAAIPRKRWSGAKKGYGPGRPAAGAPRRGAPGLHPDRDNDPVLIARLRGMQEATGPARCDRAQAALVRRDGYADLARIACPFPRRRLPPRTDCAPSPRGERMAQCLPAFKFHLD